MHTRKKSDSRTSYAQKSGFWDLYSISSGRLEYITPTGTTVELAQLESKAVEPKGFVNRII